MPTATLYSDAWPDNVNSVDGGVRENTDNDDWATIRSAAGNSLESVGAEHISLTQIKSGDVLDRWDQIWRGINLFDAFVNLDIPLGATITDVVETLYGRSKVDQLGITPNVNIYSSAPANENILVAGDFDSIGTTPFSTAITYADFNVDLTTPVANVYTFNPDGIAHVQAAINGDGLIKLGTRNQEYDADNVAPAWTDSLISVVLSWSAEKGGGYRPKLEVTYVVPTARAYFIG